jgi:hypothetical protein
MLALLTSDRRGMRHVCWDVASVQEVGLGWTQMSHAGFDRGWGLGRHVLGANYFRYVVTRGEATANTPRTSTTFPPIATGRPPCTLRRIRCFCGDRHPPRISSPIVKLKNRNTEEASYEQHSQSSSRSQKLDRSPPLTMCSATQLSCGRPSRGLGVLAKDSAKKGSVLVLKDCRDPDEE